MTGTPATTIPFTVLGASGFIGRHLVAELRSRGERCRTPDRNERWPEEGAGHVISCIGVTADFRSRPWDTLRAHVCAAVEVLERGRFESFLYLSSTRVYAGAEATTEEATLRASPTDAGDLYNLSKLAGEAACLAHPSPAVRVARVSNVFGCDRSGNFLPSLIEAALSGAIELQTSGASEKDYISVDDVVRYLVSISRSGKHRLYNVASGVNTSTEAIVEALSRRTGCRVRAPADAPALRFPPIDVTRILSEFGPARDSLVESLPDLVGRYERGEGFA